MKHEISEESKTRALRRRLLTALIVCLMSVLVICTVLFELTYRQTNKIVMEQTSGISDTTVEYITEGVFEERCACMSDLVEYFCHETAAEFSGAGRKFADKKELAECVMDRAESLFTNMKFAGGCVFLVHTGEEMFSYCVWDKADGSDYVNETFSYMTDRIHESWHEEMFGSYPDFESFLSQRNDMIYGDYAKAGRGYVIAWGNLSIFSDYDLCIAMIDFDANGWLQVVDQVADEYTADMQMQVHGLFERNLYILLAVAVIIVIVSAAISVVLSKKLADPVVSEHDSLIELNRMKTTFLSNVSHELKTPLAAMSGYAQNAEYDLMHGTDQTVIQEKLKRISAEANRMAIMVTQILDVTRIEEGRMILEPAPCDLEKTVRDTVETYFAVLNKNNNRLALKIPLDLPKVLADSSRLQRVFVNLISNALKHTHNGMIVIQAEQAGQMVEVTVKDNGSGIAAEDLAHIWERYYKGRESETGTGLGLFICKSIVESHGGTIRAESEPGKGTAFRFTLPVTA